MAKEANIINLKDSELDALRAGGAVVIRTESKIHVVVSETDVGALADEMEDDPDRDAEINRELVDSREVV